MKENKERKSNLITVRLTDNDMDTVNYLSERTNRSVSDTILRACKFGINVGDIFDERDENDQWGKSRKQQQIHLRITDTDKNMFDSYKRDAGKSMSQIVRASIRAYNNSLNGDF